MSKIEVNEIDAQYGSTITMGDPLVNQLQFRSNVVKNKCGASYSGGNIVSQSGTTIALVLLEMQLV